MIEKELSIIIPLYNDMPYFKKTVESIFDQDYDLNRVEVIIVDDGSTDGSSEFADSVMLNNPGIVQVIHIGHSGGPSRPRNIGIDHASGKYVFFCDADDWFGIGAFTKMLYHAEVWNSEVLLVKQIGEGGRQVPSSMYHADQPSVDIWTSKVFRSLGPYKLFLRGHIGDTRFPEELSIREDEVFVTEMLLSAAKVSVATDLDYYHVFQRPDHKNLMSIVFRDFDSNLFALEKLLKLTMNYSKNRGDADAVVLPRIFTSSWLACLRAVVAEDDRHQMMAQLHSISDTFITEGLIKNLPPALQLLARAFIAGEDDFALDFILDITLTPNDSYLGYDVNPEYLVIDEASRSVSLRITKCDVTEGMDLTPYLPVDYYIETTSFSNAGLMLTGTCECGLFWPSDTEFFLLAKRPDGETVAKVSLSSGCEGIVHKWSGVFARETIENAIAHTRRLELFLLAESPRYERAIRFGSRIDNRTAAELNKGCWQINHGCWAIKPVVNRSGNLNIEKSMRGISDVARRARQRIRH